MLSYDLSDGEVFFFFSGESLDTIFAENVGFIWIAKHYKNNKRLYKLFFHTAYLSSFIAKVIFDLCHHEGDTCKIYHI